MRRTIKKILISYLDAKGILKRYVRNVLTLINLYNYIMEKLVLNKFCLNIISIMQCCFLQSITRTSSVSPPTTNNKVVKAIVLSCPTSRVHSEFALKALSGNHIINLLQLKLCNSEKHTLPCQNISQFMYQFEN